MNKSDGIKFDLNLCKKENNETELIQFAVHFKPIHYPKCTCQCDMKLER